MSTKQSPRQRLENRTRKAEEAAAQLLVHASNFNLQNAGSYACACMLRIAREYASAVRALQRGKRS